MADQSENTNRTGMEHISLLVITVRSKELVIERARLDDAPIHSNQSGASVDKWGHSDREIPLGSLKSGTEI